MGYTKPFGLYFIDDCLELRWVLIEMHAYDYGRACLHTRRVVKVYVTCKTFQNNESNGKTIC